MSSTQADAALALQLMADQRSDLRRQRRTEVDRQRRLEFNSNHGVDADPLSSFTTEERAVLSAPPAVP